MTRALFACALATLALAAPARADSFMSSPQLSTKEHRLPASTEEQLNARDMLHIMQWRDDESEAEVELGGVMAPRPPVKAILFISGKGRTLGPERKFVLAYKALWDNDSGLQAIRLIGILEDCAEAAEKAGDKQQLAVMKLGISIAYEHCREHTDAGERSKAKWSTEKSAQAFRAAVTLAQTLTADASAALQEALGATRGYAEYHPKTAEAWETALEPEQRAWLLGTGDEDDEE